MAFRPASNSLVVLGLVTDEISNLDKDYFRGVTKLRYLRISYNRLQGMGSVMWMHLQLLVLEVYKNKIRSLHEMFMATRCPIYRLMRFHAAGNEITHFNTSFFSQMIRLKCLDHRENKLTHMGDSGHFIREGSVPLATHGIVGNSCLERLG